MNFEGYGKYWSKTDQPTIYDEFTISTYSGNDFDADLIELQPSTNYYILSYAITSTEDAYHGIQVQFATKEERSIAGPGQAIIYKTNTPSVIDGEMDVAWSTLVAQTIAIPYCVTDQANFNGFSARKIALYKPKQLN